MGGTPLLLALGVLFSVISRCSACTSIIVGAKASSTGSPMVTHADDCLDCDFRLNKAPARTWPAGAVREIRIPADQYPRIVSEERGPTWLPENLDPVLPQTEPVIGFIPQVSATHAYIEGQYPMMNEHQLAMGESTCGAKLVTPTTAQGGAAMMNSEDMMGIAMERTKTAQEAIKLMGSLAEEYGYTTQINDGTQNSYNDAADAFNVIDTEEAWVFHVLPDDTGASAVWVAQRLAPEQTTIVPNQFIIKEVDPDSDDFLYSANLWDVARRTGFYAEGPNGLLHFTKTFKNVQTSPFYPSTTRRMWNYFRKIKPSLELTPYPDQTLDAYPWAVEPDEPITPEFLMAMHRDAFEGTQFDMTQGVAAGPFGSPDRFSAPPGGAYERPIAQKQAATTLIATPRRELPREVGAHLWLATYNPKAALFVPFYVAMTELPRAFTHGSLFQYSADAFFWVCARIGDHMRGFHMYISPDVEAAQAEAEGALLGAQVELEAKALELLKSGNASEAVDLLTQASLEATRATKARWESLWEEIMVKWHDGFQYDTSGQALVTNRVFYPKEWLDSVGYFTSLGEEQSREHICGAPDPAGKDAGFSLATIPAETFEAPDCAGGFGGAPLLAGVVAVPNLLGQGPPLAFASMFMEEEAGSSPTQTKTPTSLPPVLLTIFVAIGCACFMTFGAVIDRHWIRRSTVNSSSITSEKGLRSKLGRWRRRGYDDLLPQKKGEGLELSGATANSC
mmetsp:Transcript_43081/g.74691  ORF Transcript_43081/g.74691 Transcript_43081/m.74691 type:complete len:734 (-) Transcript_43081:517-2718(-)